MPLSKREFILNELFLYANESEFKGLNNYLKSIANSTNNDFNKDEINNIEQHIMLDIQDSYIRKRLEVIAINPNSPGLEYFNKITPDLPTKLNDIFLKNFSNDCNHVDVSNTFRSIKKNSYDRLLSDTIIKTVNGRVNNVNYAFIMTLALIHWLFVYSTIYNITESHIRETKCASLLHKFNKYFHFNTTVDDGGCILYNIKNSISHGRIEIINDTVRIVNIRKGTIVFDGTIKLEELVKDYLSCAKDIERHVSVPADYYKMARKNIKNALNLEPISFTDPQILMVTLAYMSNDERNIKSIESFGPC